AEHVAPPGIPQLNTGSALTRRPQLTHFCFESFETLRRCSNPLLTIQSKAQELAFVTRRSRVSFAARPPVPLLAAFTFKRRCFSIQACIEAGVRSAAC
ncbi:MAG: hypothetical protein M3Y57_22975, partial [Acidobacteriota bacterium]|nr:hypothetical protein [Acidobacteriota bacterium]